MKIILAVVSLVGLASTNSLTPKVSTTSTERRQFLQTTASFLGTVVAPSLPARATDVGGGIVYGKDNIMSQKAHGTSDSPVQSDLLYGVSNKLADQISNYNRQV